MSPWYNPWGNPQQAMYMPPPVMPPWWGGYPQNNMPYNSPSEKDVMKAYEKGLKTWRKEMEKKDKAAGDKKKDEPKKFKLSTGEWCFIIYWLSIFVGPAALYLQLQMFKSLSAAILGLMH